MVSAGSQIGKYLLGKKLGHGGFGVVFRAHDSSLDREVALKFLHAEHTSTPQILQRFLQEARSAAKVAHPGIVTVYECGQIADPKTGAPDGQAYIAMELLVGESLTDRLARSGQLSPQVAMEIVRQVASALEAAHRAGIVHRDLKPDNIFLVQDPAVRTGERVKVLDFGIAKLGRAASSSVQTQSMMVFGTPRYMSPEQCKSAAHVDARSDIYTLGCILFELVCGRPPFAGQPGELIAQHLLIAPPLAASIVADLPPGLGALIGEMLAKDPDARPPTMAAVMRALESGGAFSPGVAETLLPGAITSLPLISTGSLGVRPMSANPTTLGSATGASVVQPPSKRRMKIVAGAVAAFGLGLALWFGLRKSPEPEKIAVTPPPTQLDPKPAPKPEPARIEPPKIETPPEKIEQPVKAAVKPIVKPALAGTLMIGCKPACDVVIDGGAPLHGPQQLKLPAGRHRVTLVNAELGINDSSVVDVRAGAVAKVSKDYSDRLPKPPEPPKKDGNATINPFTRGSAAP